MLMLGLLSTASIALGQHIPTFVLYTAPPVLFSGVLMLYRSIDTLGWLLIAYWAYYLILLGFTRANNRTYLARLRLAAENQSLLEALQAQTTGQDEIIATRTAELRESNHDLAQQMLRRRELERLAQEDLALLGSVINSTSDFIYYKNYSDSEGRYLGCNNAYAEFLGCSPEDILGKTDEDFFNAQETETRRKTDKAVLQEGSKVIERWIDHPHGHRMLLSASLNAFRDARGAVRGVVSIARDITELKKAEETLRYQQRSLEHLAHHDALTGLPNRLYLIDKLNHALSNPDKQAASLAVLFLDLDHFKEINDSLGHSIGDEVLRAVSRRLSDCVRKADIIARLGGDEFTIVLQGVGSSVTAVEIAQKILVAFKHPIVLRDRELVVGTSIGISVSPGDGHTTEELLRNADAAMYRAKRSGRNTFMHYTPDMTERALARLSLESDMHGALERKEFYLAYQPQVDMRSGQLIGAEALLRWDHPSRGAISPKHFIPLAEENGQILPLGKWVLQEVCAEQKRLANAGMSGIRFAVNVSGRQLLSDDPDDRAIAKTIIALGNTLNLEVIAEGVETEEQRAILVSDGCHLGQGYLFSRPLSPAGLLEFSTAAMKTPKMPP